MKKTILAILAVAALTVPAMQAQVSISYDFSGAPGNQTSTNGTASTLLITGAIVDRGAGLTASVAGDSISSTGWDDLAADDYFSFRFTIDSSLPLDFTSLALSTRSSNTGPAFMAVRSSVDSFATNLFTFTQTGTSTISDTYSLASLKGVTGAVEFRIITTSNIQARDWNVDPNPRTIQSAGTFRINSATFTAIPEPGAGLAAVALIGFLCSRRRRKS